MGNYSKSNLEKLKTYQSKNNIRFDYQKLIRLPYELHILSLINAIPPARLLATAHHTNTKPNQLHLIKANNNRSIDRLTDRLTSQLNCGQKARVRFELSWIECMRRYALNGILEFYFRNLLNRAFKFGLIVSLFDWLAESLYSQVLIEIHQTCYNNQMLYNESFPYRMRLEQNERNDELMRVRMNRIEE